MERLSVYGTFDIADRVIPHGKRPVFGCDVLGVQGPHVLEGLLRILFLKFFFLLLYLYALVIFQLYFGPGIHLRLEREGLTLLEDDIGYLRHAYRMHLVLVERHRVGLRYQPLQGLLLCRLPVALIDEVARRLSDAEPRDIRYLHELVIYFLQGAVYVLA